MQITVSQILSLKAAAAVVAIGTVAGAAYLGYQQLSPTSDSVQGKLSIIHQDNFQAKTTQYFYGVTSSAGKYTPLTFQDRHQNLLNSGPDPQSAGIELRAGANFSANFKGKRKDGLFVVAAPDKEHQYRDIIKTQRISVVKSHQIDALGRQSAPVRLAASTATLTTASNVRNIAVLRVTFSNTTGYTVPSDATVKSEVVTKPTSLTKYYEEQSGNVTGFDAPYTETVNLSYPVYTDCGTGGNQTAAQAAGYSSFMITVIKDAQSQAASDTGHPYNRSSYNHTLVAMPAVCGEGAAAYPSSDLLYTKNSFDSAFMDHEIGHNLGLSHSNSYECNLARNSNDTISGAITIDDSCKTTNYNDNYDIMGFSFQKFPHFAAVHYELLAGLYGWNKGNIRDVTTTTTINIAPISSVCTQPQILKIYRQATSGTQAFNILYVDYRQKIAGRISDATLSPTDPVSVGVGVRVGSTLLSEDAGNNGGESQFLGIVPYAKTLTDTVGRVSVTMNGVSNKGANVTVTFLP